jgi:hypothetical protein
MRGSFRDNHAIGRRAASHMGSHIGEHCGKAQSGQKRFIAETHRCSRNERKQTKEKTRNEKRGAADAAASRSIASSVLRFDLQRP